MRHQEAGLGLEEEGHTGAHELTASLHVLHPGHAYRKTAVPSGATSGQWLQNEGLCSNAHADSGVEQASLWNRKWVGSTP